MFKGYLNLLIDRLSGEFYFILENKFSIWFDFIIFLLHKTRLEEDLEISKNMTKATWHIDIRHRQCVIVTGNLLSIDCDKADFQSSLGQNGLEPILGVSVIQSHKIFEIILVRHVVKIDISY